MSILSRVNVFFIKERIKNILQIGKIKNKPSEKIKKNKASENISTGNKCYERPISSIGLAVIYWGQCTTSLGCQTLRRLQTVVFCIGSALNINGYTALI